MDLTRRQVLMAGGAALGLAGRARAAGPGTLEARPGRQQLAPEGYAETAIWGYDGRAPGPELRVAQGARLTRRLVNSLPQPTAIHWHGIRIDNAMDGVPGLTQEAVPPGGTFDYDFVAPDAGTYWYHSHNQSTEQVARGLYGPLVVDEAAPPDVDRDLVLMLGDWRIDPAITEIDPDFANFFDMSHGGRLGNLVTVNGQFETRFEVRRYQRLRLRLINAATARIFSLGLQGLDGWVVALDGMPLAAPEPLAERMLLAPAQRADLIVDVVAEPGAPAHLVGFERDGGFALVDFAVAGAEASVRRAWPEPLPPNPNMPAPSVVDAPRADLRMEGGMMSGMTGATLDGTELGFRELAQRGRFWAFNGIVGMTEAPWLDLSRGETRRIAMINDTAFPHGIHLHGHHFREMRPDGGLGPMRDTVLLDAGQTREVALVADNPGDWLLHCHMLSHQASGMKTWIRVR